MGSLTWSSGVKLLSAGSLADSKPAHMRCVHLRHDVQPSVGRYRKPMCQSRVVWFRARRCYTGVPLRGRVIATVLLTGVSLLLTVLRHEALHVVGAGLTGGIITNIMWLPRLGTLAAVEMAPPLIASPGSYYLPLCLPYVGDLLFIWLSSWMWRLSHSLLMKRAMVQHAVYFAGFDILLNCAVALIWPNDWALIFAGWGFWRYPALFLTMALTLVLILRKRGVWRLDLQRLNG
jgi:hypothetical protein